MESSQPKLLAIWNGARTVWERIKDSRSCGHWVPFSVRWPNSGMTHSGLAFELPTLEPRTLGIGSLFLRTPLTGDGSSSTRSARDLQASGRQAAILNQIVDLRADGFDGWGPYGEAIERWQEVTGRPCPAPTANDGKNGSQRLTEGFVEWCMGLPEGWVTDCGLSRAQTFKLLGNGVVPQQAEYAVRILLDRKAIVKVDPADIPDL